MKVKRMLLFLVLSAGAVISMIYVMFEKVPDTHLDPSAVNDVVETISENWADIQKGKGLPPFEYPLDYTVISNEGSVLSATRQGLSETINDAVRNRDTIVDVIVTEEMVGKIVFHNDTAGVINKNKKMLMYGLVIMFVCIIIFLMGYTFYMDTVLIRPFRKLKSFARHIAAGNLDVPLEMDQSNLFGAFTESFDLMREELSRARDNEQKAEQSKKELVASLSHDIKTPVASIKAVTEWMIVMSGNAEDKRQLEIVNMKAEQINTLVTNLFHATLEELQALEVTICEVESKAVCELIRHADYKGVVGPFNLPDCIVLADLSRLQQVLDNIISNSYKYADTVMEIRAFFQADYLMLEIADLGPGVLEEELPMLFHKFYRGKAVGMKNGYGLGLYISNCLMELMSGSIRCENRPGGFAICLGLRLA